jgi:hydroxyethylthiazole kinase
MYQKIHATLSNIKREKPLILNMTNYVTMDFVANGLLSLGALPVMSKAEEEIEDLLNLASAIVINLGTLNQEFIKLCQQACQMANDLNKPIILDPVGAGASHFRTNTCQNFIHDYAIAIIRGNASEIMALSGLSFATKGVDSTAQSQHAIESAQNISNQHNATVVISGETDVIVDANQLNQFNRGSPLMPMITGTGCLFSAVVAAFHAVEKNRFDAASAATVFYGICGEIAAKQAKGPGSFKTAFLDALNIFLENIDEKE